MMANPVEKMDVVPKDRRGLDRVLQRLARPELLIYGTPIAAGVGRQDLFCSVLREIDETILPRELLIESKRFGTIRLSVSNRRLAAIRFDHDVDQTPLVEAGDSRELAEQFAQILEQASETSEKARILRPRRLLPGTSFNMSCSAQSLAEVAGIEDFHPKASEASEDFADALSDVALALSTLDDGGELQKIRGESEDLDVLEEFYRNFVTAREKSRQGRHVNQSDPYCFMVPLGQDHTLLLALRETKQLALIPSDTIDRLTRAWHSA